MFDFWISLEKSIAPRPELSSSRSSCDGEVPHECWWHTGDDSWLGVHVLFVGIQSFKGNTTYTCSFSSLKCPADRYVHLRDGVPSPCSATPCVAFIPLLSYDFGAIQEVFWFANDI